MQNHPCDLDVERQIEAWADRHFRRSISPELVRDVQTGLKASLVPVNPLPSRHRLVLMFLGIFLAGAAGLIASVSRAGLHLMTPLQITVVSAILLIGGILFAHKLSVQMVPGSRPGVPLWIILTFSSAAVFGGLAGLFPWQTSGMFISEGWRCAVMEIAITPSVIGVFWLCARRGALFASAKLGATAAGLAAFLVLIPVQSHCVFQEAPHLLVWHGGTALLLIGMGAFGGALFRGRWIS